ncbi:hypothetical protein Taro_011229 [Colocasia esculenta]|uniref:Neprosin PEP catalytic domain-containing protein n=1 Tax=Colocasia esculenta TaxID=4460 RepID=A0A843U9L4_COLES|nr:hypothetical protein [Colocasia esculenta]
MGKDPSKDMKHHVHDKQTIMKIIENVNCCLPPLPAARCACSSAQPPPPPPVVIMLAYLDLSGQNRPSPPFRCLVPSRYPHRCCPCLARSLGPRSIRRRRGCQSRSCRDEAHGRVKQRIATGYPVAVQVAVVRPGAIGEPAGLAWFGDGNAAVRPVAFMTRPKSRPRHSCYRGVSRRTARDTAAFSLALPSRRIAALRGRRRPLFRSGAQTLAGVRATMVVVILRSLRCSLKPNYPGKPNNHVIEASRPWNLSKSCPPGSIPVERTQRNSHFGRNLSINHWYMAPHHFRQHTGRNSFEDGSEVHEYSTIRLHGNFYGAKASINVWNPKTEKQNELSVSQIWVASEDLVTSLEAGWMVNHYLTGCYNIDCPGFVQTNRNTLLSTYLRPVSVYGGPQYVIDIEIFKDRITGNWWLRRQGVDMGYWPNQLVPSLAGGARRIDFGGEIAYIKSGAHTSTDMGSGHYPYEGFSKSSFFRKVEVLDPSYVYRNPEHASVSVDNGGCYDLEIGRKQDGPWGYFFFYGGPGRSEKCS